MARLLKSLADSRRQKTQNSGADAAQSFPKFSELPAELQIKIWKAALPERRFVNVLHNSNADGFWSEILYDHADDYFFSRTPVPGLLHACFDSRKIMMEAGWRLEFPSRTEKQGRIWFNLQKDVVYFPYDGLLDSRGTDAVAKIPKEQRNKIKRLATAVSPGWTDAIKVFPNLEELSIIVQHGGQMPKSRKSFRFRSTPHLPFPFRNRFLFNSYVCAKAAKGLIAPEGSRKKLKLHKNQILTFLDADPSEAAHYPSQNFHLRDVIYNFYTRGFTPSGNAMPRHWFKEAERLIGEAVKRNAVNAAAPRLRETAVDTLKVRIGIVLPEAKVTPLLELREKYWNKHGG